MEYRDGKPLRVDYIVIAASDTDAVITRDGKHTTEDAKREIIDKIVCPVVGGLMDANTHGYRHRHHLMKKPPALGTVMV